MWRIAVVLVVVAALACGSAPAAPAATTRPASTQPTVPIQTATRKVAVVSVAGEARKMAHSDGQAKWEPLRAGEMLDEMTVIQTGLGAQVLLRFADRAEVTVNSATKMGISQFRTKGDAAEMRIGLKYGTLRTSVQAGRGTNDFQVSTPAATLTVRGTVDDVGFSGDAGLQVQGWSGKMLVQGPNGEVNVYGGEFTDAQLTQAIQFLLRLWDVGLGDVFGGLTPAERANIRDYGAGRGGIGFFGATVTLGEVSVRPADELPPPPPPPYPGPP